MRIRDGEGRMGRGSLRKIEMVGRDGDGYQ